MHTYLLAFFEKLLREELKQKQPNHADTENRHWTTAIINIQKQKNEFLDGFSRTLFKAREVNEIEWRVQIYQQKIVTLLDNVAEMIGKHELVNVSRFEPEACYANVLKTIHSSLSEMLCFIETDFTKYIDVNVKVPISYQLLAVQKIEFRLKAVNKSYAKTEVSRELLTIVLLPFQDFLSNAPDGYITYQRMSYLNALLRELEELCTNNHIAHIDEIIHAKLREMNFNHPKYFTFCTEKIREELSELSSKEQLEHLIWILKQIDQVQQRTGAVYHSLQETLQQQLRLWITAEINFLKEISSLPGAVLLSGDSARWKDFKVITQFSVPQLGHVIRLLSDTGIFVNENKKEMLDFFSEYFTSTKKENISAGSLRKHFYASDNSAVQGVRDKLFSLLNQSKKSMVIGLTLLLSV